MATLTISPPFKVPLSPTLGGTGVANASGNTISFTGGSLSIADGASVFSLTGGTSASVLTIVAGKTLRANNTLTLAGTDATTMTFPAISDTVACLATAQTFTKAQTITLGAAGVPLTINDTNLSTGGNAVLVNSTVITTGQVVRILDTSVTSGFALDVRSTALTSGSVGLFETNHVTSGKVLYLYQDTSAFTGVALQMDIATGSGSFTAGYFLVCNNNSVSKFYVDHAGTTTILGGCLVSGLIDIQGNWQTPGSITSLAVLPRLPAGAATATGAIWLEFNQSGNTYYLPGWH